jgi:hypothetical protein
MIPEMQHQCDELVRLRRLCGWRVTESTERQAMILAALATRPARRQE